MSATNKTQHYNLPQFVAGDIPAWMTDVNNAMATIDGAIYDVASDEATVGESVAQLGTRVTSAENTVASLGTTVQGVQGDVAENTADIGTLKGNVNGVGTRMTAVEGRATTLEGKVTTLEGETAEDIPYDNTDSGLTATDVQSAIDEIAQSGGGGGSASTTQLTSPLTGTSFTSNYVMKDGNSVYFHATIVANEATSIQTQVIGVLPEGYRPASTLTTGIVVGVISTGVVTLGRLIVSNTGTITAQLILPVDILQAVIEGVVNI